MGHSYSWRTVTDSSRAAGNTAIGLLASNDDSQVDERGDEGRDKRKGLVRCLCFDFSNSFFFLFFVSMWFWFSSLLPQGSSKSFTRNLPDQVTLFWPWHKDHIFKVNLTLASTFWPHFYKSFLDSLKAQVLRRAKFQLRTRSHEPMFMATVLSLLEDFLKLLVYYLSYVLGLWDYEEKWHLGPKFVLLCHQDWKTTPSWAKIGIVLVFCMGHRRYWEEMSFLPWGLQPKRRSTIVRKGFWKFLQGVKHHSGVSGVWSPAAK